MLSLNLTILTTMLDCYVSTGGYIERVLAASGGSLPVISKYLTTCKNVGFDVLEISSGFLSIPTNDWAELVEVTAKHGLKPKPEVGIQYVADPAFIPFLFTLLRRWGAGGDATVAELESAGTRDPKWLIDRANVFLQAGAHVCHLSPYTFPPMCSSIDVR